MVLKGAVSGHFEQFLRLPNLHTTEKEWLYKHIKSQT